MPRRDSVESAGAFLSLVATTLAGKAGTESTGFSESLHAVVDHDGDHDHGDGHRCHPGQDGTDASNSIVNDGANHPLPLSIRPE
jgi:hypothetical protein